MSENDFVKKILDDNGFEKLEGRIVCEYIVKAKSDLHIGAGSTSSPGEVDMPVLKDIDDYPIVPGSSLKGVLRSDLERFLNAVFDDRRTADAIVAILFGPSPRLTKQYGFASSIRIRDATAKERRTFIRDGVRIDLGTRKAAAHGKYDIEVVPRGTEFIGTLVIENPDIKYNGETYKNAKLGALLQIVDFFNITNASLGGAVSRGFGEVEISLKKIRLYKPDDYLAGNRDGDLNVNQEEAIKTWKDFILGLKNAY